MTIEALHTGIEFAADKPFCIGQIPVEHRIPLAVPLQFFSPGSPPSLPILIGTCVNGGIGNIGLSDKFCGRNKCADFR